MRGTVNLVYLTSFLFLFGETLQPAPRIAIYESIVCQQHYASSTLPSPHDCKIAPVQQELAFLGGIERLSIIIPSILAIPFAALADRYGHSLILSIAIFGVFLEDSWPFLVCWFPDVFPIRLIWLHFVFSMIGGGFTVVVTLLHVIIADVVSAEERTKIFFRARAAGVAASILGYAASGFMMRANDYVSWAVGLVCLMFGSFAAKMIPNATVQESNKLVYDDHAVVSWGERGNSLIETSKHIYLLLVGNKQVLTMLILVFLCQLGFDSVPMMLAIYVSKRFSWTFSNASFLNSLEMSVEFLTLVVLLPLVTSSLPSTFRRLPSFTKDKCLAQGSLFALSLGTLCLGLAPVVSIAVLGVIILALGAGQDSLLRSIATDMVRTSEISTMYSAITMLRAIGGSVSGPIYAWLYATGLRQERGVWLGLPYLVAGVFFLAASGLLMVVRDPRKEGFAIVDDEAGEPLLN